MAEGLGSVFDLRTYLCNTQFAVTYLQTVTKKRLSDINFDDPVKSFSTINDYRHEETENSS